MMRRLLKFILLGAIALGARWFWKASPSVRRAPKSETPDAEQESWSERLPIKRWLKTGAAFFAVLGVVSFLIAASGIIPIKASSGHWAITRWFLSFSMHRSVATHTIGMEVPPLDDPGLVLKGAGHYETGCRPCHGSPSLHRPRIPSQMTPHPPYLPEEIPKWEPEELFYIVKHGVKFTGMPAWPAQQREDEVWAMVAFLRALPDLSAQEYRRLVEQEAPVKREAPAASEAAPIQGLLSPQSVPPAVTQSCARCHGIDGLGRGRGAFPRLAGQHPTYLRASLQAYARGERFSGIMESVAAGLSREEMRELALYYGRQDTSWSSTVRRDLQAIGRGKKIAHEGVPSRRIPSCVDCHGPAPTRRNPAYPILAGQYADYLVLQLELFKKGSRGGTVYTRLMDPVVHRLTPEQMQDVALFYESLTEEE